MKVKYIVIPQTVRVRKYEIDKDKLVRVLRSNKSMSNKEISEKLGVPITKVEHWFRTDDGFAVPDENIWFCLKDLLKINSDEFDAAITEFVLRDGVYEKSERCYLTDGLSPTLTTLCEHEKVVIRT